MMLTMSDQGRDAMPRTVRSYRIVLAGSIAPSAFASFDADVRRVYGNTEIVARVQAQPGLGRLLARIREQQATLVSLRLEDSDYRR
jgi:hypothetical protein